MPKSAGAKRKAKNAGVGVDFKRARHKVGKKLPKAQNETDTNFKSRAIALPGQSVGEDKGAAVTQRNLTLKELLRQSGHYSQKVRAEALRGAAELLGARPEELKRETGPALQKLADRVTDGDKAVRAALRQLLAQHVLPALQGRLAPFVPLLMAHVCSAMTHLDAGIRGDALGFLELLTAAAPGDVEAEFLYPALQHYADLLSPASRGRSVSARSLASLHQAMSSLERFLSSCESLRQAASQPQQQAQLQQGGRGLWAGAAAWTPRFQVRKVQAQLAQLAAEQGHGAAVVEAGQQEAVLGQLAAHLLAAWGECTSAAVEEAGAPAAYAAMAACLHCLRAVLRRLQAESEGAAAQCRAAVLAKVGRDVPMRLAGARASQAKLQAIVQVNLAGLQLLTSLLVQQAAQGQGQEGGWVGQLLDFYAAVMEEGEAVPPDEEFGASVQQPPVPAETYAAILSGLEAVLPAVPWERRRRLLQAFAQLDGRLGAKSASRAACLRFMASVAAQPRRFAFAGGPPGAVPVVLPEELASWIQAVPKVLWEAGSSRPDSSRLCLQLLLDAARYSPAEGPVAAALEKLEPQLALFYCTQLPPGKQAGGGKLLSPLAKLPPPVQALAAHLLFYLPTAGTVTAAVLRLAAAQLLPDGLLARMAEALHLRLRARGQDAELLQLALSLAESLQEERPELTAAAAAATTAATAGDAAVLAQVEGRLLKALQGPDASQAPVLACIGAAVAGRRQCRGASSDEAASSSQAQSSLPAALVQALPAALSRALVTDQPASSKALSAENSSPGTALATAEGLLAAEPGMWPGFLRALPDAAAPASSRPVPSHAGMVAAAAAALVRLCDSPAVLQQLSGCQADLQAASRWLSELAEGVGGATVEGQRCQAACQLLRATVLRLTGAA